MEKIAQEDETQYGTVTYVRLPEDLREPIEQMARTELRTISSQIVLLLRKALADDPAAKRKAESRVAAR